MPHRELVETLLTGEAIDHYADPLPSTSQFDHISNQYHFTTFAAELHDFILHNSELKPHLEPTFFIWFFLGSFFNLPDSGLMANLGFKDLYVKYNAGMMRVAFSHQVENKPIKLCFRTIWMPGRRPIEQDPGMFSSIELAELANKWNLDFFNLHLIDIDTKYLEFKTIGDPNDQKTFDIIWKTQTMDHTRHLLSIVCKNKLTNKMFLKPHNIDRPAFATITASTGDNVADMQSLFTDIQKTNVETVRATVAQLLNKFRDVYKQYKDTVIVPVGGAEAYSGYMAGIFTMNYRNRYKLQCNINRYAINQNILISILPMAKINPRLSSSVPIILDTFEAHYKPSQRLQFLKKSGSRELLPSFDTDSKLAVLGVSSFDKVDSPDVVGTVEINQGILFKFMKVYEHSLRGTMHKNGECFLNLELHHLMEQMGQVKASLIAAYLYGQILSIPSIIHKDTQGVSMHVEDEEVVKYIFKYKNAVLDKEITTFFLVHGSNMIVLNIGKKNDKHQLIDAFFNLAENNLFILPEGIYPQDILHINFLVDNIQGSTIKVKRMVPQELTTAHSTIHNGEAINIGNVQVAQLMDDLNTKRFLEVKAKLSPSLFEQKSLVVDSVHLKALLKGLFASRMMSLSALEQNSGSVVIILHQELPRYSTDYSLGEMLVSPTSSDNVLWKNSPVIIKLNLVQGITPENRQSIVENSILGFWVEYFTSMEFPKEESKPTLFSLVFNTEATEVNDVIEGEIWHPDDGLESLIPDVTTMVSNIICANNRRKRDAHRCLFEKSEWDEFAQDKQSKTGDYQYPEINSDKFSTHCTYEDSYRVKQMVEYISKKALKENVEITGSKKQAFSSLMQNSHTLNQLNKASRYANAGTMGLIAKDIISSIAHGNYTQAAVTTSFIIGSVALGMTANGLKSLGLRFGLQGLKLRSIFLRGSAPFIGKLASGFIIYDLIRNIKILNGEDRDIAIAGIVGDTTFLVIDAIDIGIAIAETFGVIEGVSSVFGPIGMAVGALVFLGTNIYSAVKTVGKIDQVIELTTGERIAEGFRAFFGMNPEEHIQILMEHKERYNGQVEGAHQYMLNNTRIKNFFFPMQYHDGGKWKDNENNWIDVSLRIKSNSLARYKPDAPPGSRLNCFNVNDDAKFTIFIENHSPRLMATNDEARTFLQEALQKITDEELPNSYDHACFDSIGITNLKSTGSYSMFHLNNGIDYVNAFNNSPNIFLIGDGTKMVQGGQEGDLFVLTGNKTFGSIMGQEGTSNTLDLTHFGPSYSQFIIHLVRPHQQIIYDNYTLNLQGITKVIGRPNNTDKIIADCNTEFINSGDGKNDVQENHDQIKINDRTCIYKTTIKVGTNTNIENVATFGEFTYLIDAQVPGRIMIYIDPISLADHRFIFDQSIESLVSMRHMGNENLLVLHFKSGKRVHVNGYRWTNCSFFFVGGIELKYNVGRNSTHFHAYGSIDQNPFYIVKLYSDRAERLNTSFTIKSKANQDTILISHSNDHIKTDDPNINPSNVLHNDPDYPTYIYGGNAENVYIISTGREKFETIEDAKIAPIRIFESPSNNYSRTIVLQYFADQLERDLNCSLYVSVNRGSNFNIGIKHNVVLLELFAIDKNGEFYSLTYIVLQKHFQNRLYEKFHIIIHDVPMKIVFDEQLQSFNPKLQPLPIEISEDVKFMVLNSQYVIEDMEYEIPRYIEDFYFLHGNTGSLTLLGKKQNSTKMLKDPFYIMLDDLYANPNSILKTLKFMFKNKLIDMKNEAGRILAALPFTDILTQYNNDFMQQLHNFVEKPPRVVII